MLNNKIVAITGFRPEKMPFAENESDEKYLRFIKELKMVIKRLIQLDYTVFISGIAQGFDTWCAEIALDFGGKVECAIPFPAQAEFWTE